MKKKTKILGYSLCAVLLVMVSILGTLAYLTATDEAINTFTVGDVDIVLDETDVDEMGKPTGNDRDKTNEYHLIPGYEYTKDPMVTVVKGSEDCYVRMLLTINQDDVWQEICSKYHLTIHDFIKGYEKDKWVFKKETTKDNTRTYEFWYYDQVDKDSEQNTELAPIFKTLVVPEVLTKEDIAALKGFEMNVVAHAIQAGSFENAEKAWEAFK